MLLPLVLQVQITLKSKTQQRRPRHHNLWHSVCRALIASCDTVFICFWIGTEWWRGHFGSGQAEGATESASQRRDLILARRETLEFTIGRSHLHSLPDLSCRGRLLCKRYTSNFWEKALRSLHWRFCTDVLACFGQLSAADLCLMRISVPKSVICWSCKPRASDFSRQGVEPNEAAAQAILQVLGSARGGSSSSRLEFGEAEARWKVTKSRHVIAEGFLRSVHRQQGSNKGRSSNKANKGRNSKNVLHLHLWAANRFLVLTFAEIIWDPFVQMFGFQLWMFTAIVAATQNLES